jgi:UDP-2,3-diacylglucosamine pyrophosphatase LpxH
MNTLANPFIKCKTVYLSDIHLGSKDSQVEHLINLLNSIECEKIFLLGDIIDLWSMKKRFWWPANHYEVIQILFKMSQSGTRVIYIPGNHDASMREYVSSLIGGIEILEEAIHITAAGKKLLLVHGDCFDEHILVGRFAKFIGNFGYPFLLWANRNILKFTSFLGYQHWSLASYIKNRIKGARQAIETFENAAVSEVKRRKLDGIICGHIHQPDLKLKDGVIYCNDGDWVEHCTAIIEEYCGNLKLLDCTSFSMESDNKLSAANDSYFEAYSNLKK